jgi:hypothetical protein
MSDKNTVKVRIFKPHTHAGQKLVPPPEGLEIEVTAPEAAWLKAQGVDKRPEPLKSAAAVG